MFRRAGRGFARKGVGSSLLTCRHPSRRLSWRAPGHLRRQTNDRCVAVRHGFETPGTPLFRRPPKGKVAASVRSVIRNWWHGLLSLTLAGVSKARDERSFIVAPCECEELGRSSSMVLNVRTQNEVLLQGSDEALGDAIAPRVRARRTAKLRCPRHLDLALEIAGHVIGAMVVTQLEPTRHAGRDG